MKSKRLYSDNKSTGWKEKLLRRRSGIVGKLKHSVERTLLEAMKFATKIGQRTED